MQIVNSLKKRRTYYNIKKELPVPIEKVIELVEEVTELVPDSFNMKSSRAVIVHGEMQDKLWDTVYNAFEGKVSEEKYLFSVQEAALFYIFMTIKQCQLYKASFQLMQKIFQYGQIRQVQCCR